MCQGPTRISAAGARAASVLLLFALALAALLPRTATWPLRHWDEAWYAETSREILEYNDWLTLRWNNQHWFHKPPLAFWGTSIAYLLFGVSEFSARLFSSLCGLAAVLATALFLGGRRGPAVGFLAGALLLAIPEFSRYATRGQTDAPLTLFVALNLFAFWRGLDRPNAHLAGGVALGLAAMTKGAAAGLACVVQLAYMLVARDGRAFRQRQWWTSGLIAVAVAAPWHVHQLWTHGDAFASVYFSRHFTQFFCDIYPEVDHAAASAWYYLDFLLRKEPLWGWGAVLAAVWGGWAVVRRPRDRLLIFAWCWTVSIPLALSASWAKWHWYLLPAYPGLATLAALLAERALEGTRAWRWAPAAAAACAVLAALEIVQPADRELEIPLRAIGPRIQRRLPPGSQFVALQIDDDRNRSVYPVTPRFYAQRNVLALHSLDALERAATHAGNVVHALVHADLVPEIRARGRADETGSAGEGGGGATPNDGREAGGGSRDAGIGYEVEIVDREGDVAFLCLIPGWLAEEVRHAARNRAESR
jgi:4-amino-4-deoxy-L-arabinose transferase-like glycosyltransferase